ncbi:MAG: protein kinase, partial [Bacteroidales bacterium]|nr:protein kinase [Bacteroidales bacterium]
DANGKVYLTDFGIARMSDAATATLVRVGTPAYMAPELVRGMDPSPQTDIYALGVVLYELITGGERPFTGEKASITGTTAEKVRWEQLNQAPVSPRVYNPSIPGALENLVLRCLVKEPGKRYPDALELLNALQAAVSSPAPGTQARRSATQAFDQPRKETSKPESARSGKFEDGVYREAAPYPKESTSQHVRETVQAAAPKPSSSGKRTPADKNLSYFVLFFLLAMGLLALIASISSAERNKQEELQRRYATQTAVYESTATAQARTAREMVERIQQNASDYVLDSSKKEFKLVFDNSDNFLECELIAEDLTNFILEATFTNPGDDSKGWTYGILFRNYGDSGEFRLELIGDGWWRIVNRKDEDWNIIQSVYSSVIRQEIYATNRVRLVGNGSEGYLFINEAYEGRLDLSSRLGAGKLMICTGMVRGIGSDGNIIKVEAVRLWEIQ